MKITLQIPFIFLTMEECHSWSHHIFFYVSLTASQRVGQDVCTLLPVGQEGPMALKHLCPTLPSAVYLAETEQTQLGSLRGQAWRREEK